MTARYDFASDDTAPATPEAMAAIVAANQGFTPGLWRGRRQRTELSETLRALI